MKTKIQLLLSEQLDNFLVAQGFCAVSKGKIFVRNMNYVFQVIQISIEEGTSNIEDGYRVKLFADIWSPYLTGSIKEIKTFPEIYDPLIGGQVSKVRINGNGLIDIDKEEEISTGVREIGHLIESMVLPWFELFYDIESTKKVLKNLSIDVNDARTSDKDIRYLNNKFPPCDVDVLKKYNRSDAMLDSRYLADEILPVFNSALSVTGFNQHTSNGQEIFLKTLDNEVLCSVSFELIDAVFFRVWLHIIKPEMLPEGYWEQLSRQYIVPPLIGRPVDATSMCLLRVNKNDIESFVEKKVLPEIELLYSKEGLVTFIKEVTPGGILGKSIDELLAVL